MRTGNSQSTIQSATALGSTQLIRDLNVSTIAPSYSHLEPLNSPFDAIKALSIDNLIFSIDQNELKILLVKQSDPMHEGKWALPGGWIRYDENLRCAAYRLLEELTGIRQLYLEQLKTFGRVDRFPTQRVVTVAYYALVSAENYSLVKGKSANTSSVDISWQSVKNVSDLVYDHADILAYGIKFLRHKVRHQPIGFNLLPEKFTLLQLQAMYEAILGVKLDKPNFRRKIIGMNLLTPCNEKQQGVAHRAANLYRFDNDVYQRLTDSGFSFTI